MKLNLAIDKIFLNECVRRYIRENSDLKEIPVIVKTIKEKKDPTLTAGDLCYEFTYKITHLFY